MVAIPAKKFVKKKFKFSSPKFVKKKFSMNFFVCGKIPGFSMEICFATKFIRKNYQRILP